MIMGAREAGKEGDTAMAMGAEPVTLWTKNVPGRANHGTGTIELRTLFAIGSLQACSRLSALCNQHEEGDRQKLQYKYTEIMGFISLRD